MRKALIILLTGIHLLGNTEFGQILRWPELFSHYFQHTHINPDINFLEFIAMHYDGDDGTDADNDPDNKLPCRDIGHNSLATMFSPMVRTVIVENFSPVVDAIKAEYSTNSTFSGFELTILASPDRLVNYTFFYQAGYKPAT